MLQHFESGWTTVEVVNPNVCGHISRETMFLSWVVETAALLLYQWTLILTSNVLSEQYQICWSPNLTACVAKHARYSNLTDMIHWCSVSTTQGIGYSVTNDDCSLTTSTECSTVYNWCCAIVWENCHLTGGLQYETAACVMFSEQWENMCMSILCG